MPSTKRLFRIAGAAACAAFTLGATLAGAQDYPVKPVRVIVPFPPGAATDVLGRLVAQKLTEKWGQSVVVDNKPGAGSIIAAELGAKAAPDGYTVFMGHIGTHGANPALYAKLPYDPVKDFAPVSLMVTIPNLFAVHPAVPANNMRELLDLARAKPGSLNISTPGVGTSAHLMVGLFKASTGIDIIHVPFKGSVASMQGVMAGEVQATLDTVTSVLPQARAGRVRLLAISSKDRSPLAPEVPPLGDTVPGFDVATWFAFFVPAGTPRAVIDKLSTETVAALKTRDVTERLQAQGMNLFGSTPEELGAHVRAELARWGKVVREANIRIE